MIISVILNRIAAPQESKQPFLTICDTLPSELGLIYSLFANINKRF
jgi:hypothetical protein